MTIESNARSILGKHQLKKTLPRVEILKSFLNNSFALSHKDIEEQLEEGYDRVTIYRTLNTFEDNGLIHRVHDTSGIVKYALCTSECTSKTHKDEHVHFNCEVCGNIYCFENSHIPAVEIPKGYSVKSRYLFVQGICKNCKK